MPPSSITAISNFSSLMHVFNVVLFKKYRFCLTSNCIHSQAWKVFKLFHDFNGFWNLQQEMETDDDHATVRENFSLVQNILFCDYPDTLPAQSRKTRFNRLSTTFSCIWLQCALVCLRYIYWNVCTWNIFADHPHEIPSLFLSQAFTASKCCSTHNLLASTSSIAFKIPQWINIFCFVKKVLS